MSKYLYKLPYMLFIFLLPVTTLPYLNSIFKGWHVNASVYFLVILSVVIIMTAVLNKKIYPGAGRVNKIITALLIVLSIIYLSYLIMLIFFAGTIAADSLLKPAIFRFLTCLIIFVSIYIPIYYIRSDSDFSNTLRILYCALFLLIILGYIQILAQFHISGLASVIVNSISDLLGSGWGVNSLISYVDLFGRINLTTPEASEAGHLLECLFLPFLMAAVITKKSISLRRFWGLSVEKWLLILVLPLILCTYSSAAYIVFIGQAVVMAAIMIRNSHISKRTLVVFVSSIILILTIVYGTGAFKVNESANVSTSITKIFDIRNNSTNTRYGFMAAGFDMFLDYPVIGVGLGNSELFFAEYIPWWAYNNEVLEYIAEGEYMSPKSLLVLFLAETGIVGTLLLAGWFFMVFYMLKQMGDKNIDNKYIYYAMLIYGAAFIGHSFNSSYISFIWIWSIWGIYASAAGLNQSQKYKEVSNV
ncbi:MAG: O-antigen ligase family protein [Syntrophomonadaceae bacterium]|nr:O-antigen ligase family protein [Syntrophomonadaceae bacterium]